MTECIAAKAQNAKRNLKFGLIRHIGQRTGCDNRVRTQRGETFSKVCAGRTQFLCKQALRSGRRKIRFNDCKKLCGRRFAVCVLFILCPVNIDLHGSVENQRKLFLKAFRNRQIGKTGTAGKCRFTDFLYGFGNPEGNKRIAVREGVFRNAVKGRRQAELLKLTRCSKCIRTEIPDGIRQNDAVRTDTAGKGVHVNDFQPFGDNNVHTGRKTVKCLCGDSADGARQEHGL